MIDENILYFPALHTKQAELAGLKKVRQDTMARVWPSLYLTRHNRQKTSAEIREKIIESTHGQCFFLGLPDNIAALPEDSSELVSPDKNYRNWKNFVASFDKARPLLLSPSGITLRQTVMQARALIDEFGLLGMRVKTDEDLVRAEAVLAAVDDPEAFYPILDAGHLDCKTSPVAQYQMLTSWINQLRSEYGGIDLIMQSSCFPRSLGTFGDSHGSIENRDRELHSMLGGYRTIRFGDFGSVNNNPTTLQARGFVPRIDVCGPLSWEYARFRNRNGGYVRCAQEAMNFDDFESADDGIWAKEIIQKMAESPDPLPGFGSPAKWIAIRVSFHIEVQTLSLSEQWMAESTEDYEEEIDDDFEWE